MSRLFLLTLCMGLVVAAPAAAHGLIERSSPPANSALDVAPRQIDLWFNEPVDPAFSSATVTDPAGDRVSGGAVVSSSGRKMTVPLRELGRGFYTVRWRVLSAVDGHTTGGVFAFTVGLGARPPESFGEAAAPERGLALIRWIGFAAAVLATGALFFSPFVLRPGLRRASPGEAWRLEDDAGRRLRRLVIVASVGVLASAAAEIVLRVTTLTDTSLGRTLTGGQLATLLWTTKPGWSALVRVSMAALVLLPPSPRGQILRAAGVFWVLLVAGVFALLGGPSGLSGGGHLALLVLIGTVYGLTIIMMTIILPQVRDFRMPDLPAVPVVAGAVLLGGFTINSHGWGSGALAALADWVHLLAASIWIGGLASLIVVVAGSHRDDRPRLASALVPAMSRVATISLTVLVLTGIYSGWLHMPGLRAFTLTLYGRYLLGKLALVVPLVALGAVSRFALMPRLAVSPPSPPKTILAVVGGEVGLGLGVLAVVALLTATPPAAVALATSSAAASALRLTGASQDVRLALAVNPAQPGPNQVEVTAAHPDGQPVEGEARVLLRLTKLDEDLAPVTMTLDGQGDGRYVLGGVAIPAGWWEAEVVLRRQGRLDAVASFPLRLGQAPAAATDPSAARLAEGVNAAMMSLRTWREVEQITDGAGGLVVARVELVRPNRMRIATSAGAEVIFIGTTRWLREPAGWRSEALARSISVEGTLQYLRGASAVVMGRPAACDSEPCRVLLWEAQGRAAAFAGWIGTDSRRIYKILMVAPQHYMTGHVSDFNAPIRVDAPR